MIGDKLASGARSASFAVAPNLKFDEKQMREDLDKLPASAFMSKYMITPIEYDLINHGDEKQVNDFAEQMKRQAEFYERGLASDAQQEASLKRECFITPFVPMGITGRVIVDRDVPPKRRSPITLPNSMRKDKTLLPTTGHIIKAVVYDTATGLAVSDSYIGKRVLFGQMSGTAICFKGYPTWIELELSEILAIVHKEDVDAEEIPLEPMV